MKALTLIQPWAYAVCYLGKRIENRTWAPPAKLSYGVIAIHAGRRFNDDDALWLHETLGCGSIDCAQSAVVATARVQRVVEYGRDLPPGVPGVPDEQRRWAFGPLCWLLSDVQVLREPVSCRGMQGLWQLPPEVEALVVAAAPLPRCCPHHAYGLGTCSACGGVGFVRADDVTELAEQLQVPVLQLCVRCGLGWRRGGVC